MGTQLKCRVIHAMTRTFVAILALCTLVALIYPAYASDTCPPESTCGNSVIDPGEYCDDPNDAECIDCQAAGRIIDACSGDLFTCVVHESGRIRCYGRNTYGEIGGQDVASHDGDRYSADPTETPTLASGASAIACARRHVCAIIDGKVKC